MKVVSVYTEDMAADGHIGPNVIGHDELGGDAIQGVSLTGQEGRDGGVVPCGLGGGELVSVGEEINFHGFAGMDGQGGIDIGMNEESNRPGNVGAFGQNAAVEEHAHGNVEGRFGDALGAGSGRESRDQQEQE